jgi:hypothetical protein
MTALMRRYELRLSAPNDGWGTELEIVLGKRAVRRKISRRRQPFTLLLSSDGFGNSNTWRNQRIPNQVVEQPCRSLLTSVRKPVGSSTIIVVIATDDDDTVIAFYRDITTIWADLHLSYGYTRTERVYRRYCRARI